ncbi:15845_t:CDS:2, partial [Gigaspora margarita]
MSKPSSKRSEEQIIVTISDGLRDARHAEHSNKWSEQTTIYVYSKELGKVLVKYVFGSKNFEINSLHFIKGDCLLFKTDGPKYRMMNPRTRVNIID